MTEYLFDKPLNYWAELHLIAKNEGVEDVIDKRVELLEEISELHAKLAFYEDRIRDMCSIMGKKSL